MATATQIGPMLRDWRHHRRRSQFELSLDVGVSAKHLSFVETGRSRPSPELILALGVHLDVPLREQNRMLLAAGYAPRFSHTPLDDVAMARVRQSVQRMLDAHDPYPGVVIDRQWNVVAANQAAGAFTAVVGEDARGRCRTCSACACTPTASPHLPRTSPNSQPTCSANSAAASR